MATIQRWLLTPAAVALGVFALATPSHAQVRDDSGSGSNDWSSDGWYDDGSYDNDTAADVGRYGYDDTAWGDEDLRYDDSAWYGDHDHGWNDAGYDSGWNDTGYRYGDDDYGATDYEVYGNDAYGEDHSAWYDPNQEWWQPNDWFDLGWYDE